MSGPSSIAAGRGAFARPLSFLKLLSAFLLAVSALFAPSTASAERKILYVHGKNDMFCYNGAADRCYKDGDYGARYWGGNVGPTPNSSAFYVGYNATSDPREWGVYVNGLRLSDGVYTGDGPAWNRAQSQIHAALWWGSEPTYGGAACNSANNWCTLACHSAGCYAIDYYFSNFNPAWEAQSGTLNLYSIYAVSSATGGSELADNRWGACASIAAAAGQLATWPSDERGWPITAAMQTAQARAFNHNVTFGRVTYHTAGSNSGAAGYCTDNYFGTRNDGALAFHSQCGYETTHPTNNCSDAGGWCASWTSCPWYNPFCTQYCQDFRKYNHWPGHVAVTSGASFGVSGWAGDSFSFNKTHAQMKTVLKPMIQATSEF